MVVASRNRSVKIVPILTHLIVFVVGGVVVGVFGNFATDLVKSVFSPPQYTTYTASAPACESSISGWTTSQAQLDCSAPNHLTLHVSNPPATGAAVFIDPHQPFPADYRAAVTVSHISPGDCAGILARGHPVQGTGYVAFICPSRGVWQISRFDSGGTQPLILATGVLPSPAPQSYSLVLSTQGDTYQLLINGVFTGGGGENVFPGTQSVALMVSPSGFADFTDFSVTQAG